MNRIPMLTAVFATAVLALLVAACGGSPAGHVAQLAVNTTQGSSSANSPAASAEENQALAFSRCMRLNGVPKFPDASSTNETPSGLPKVSPRELGVSSSQFQAAENACRPLLPNGGAATPAVSEQTLTKLVAFAGCMRSNGVPNWPDPTAVSAQAPPGAPPYTFDLHGLQGLDTRTFSPQISTAMNECFHLTHLTDSEVPWSS